MNPCLASKAPVWHVWASLLYFNFFVQYVFELRFRVEGSGAGVGVKARPFCFVFKVAAPPGIKNFNEAV